VSRGDVRFLDCLDTQSGKLFHYVGWLGAEYIWPRSCNSEDPSFRCAKLPRMQLDCVAV